jgi:hypothetical protein
MQKGFLLVSTIYQDIAKKQCPDIESLSNIENKLLDIILYLRLDKFLEDELAIFYLNDSGLFIRIADFIISDLS